MNEAFARVARAAMAELLRAEPIRATGMGEHLHDGQLPDYSSAAREALSDSLAQHLSALDAVDDLELDHAENVDLDILRAVRGARGEVHHLESHGLESGLWTAPAAGSRFRAA